MMKYIFCILALTNFNVFAADSTNYPANVSVAPSNQTVSEEFTMNIAGVPKIYAGKTCVLNITSQSIYKIDDPVLLQGNHPNPAIRAAQAARYDRYRTVRGYTWTFSFASDGLTAVITSNGGHHPSSLTYIEGAYYTTPFSRQNSVELSSDYVRSGVTYYGSPMVTDVFDFHPTYGNANEIFGACS